MWSSKCRAFFRSSIRSHSRFQSKVPSKTLALTLTQLPSSVPVKWAFPGHFQNPRFFSSGKEAEYQGETSEAAIDGNGGFDENPGFISQAPDVSSVAFADELSNDAGTGESPSWNLEESDSSAITMEESADSSFGLGKDNDKTEVGGEGLGSLWEESIHLDDPKGSFTSEESIDGMEAEVSKIDIQQVENVVSVLLSTSQEPIELSLDKMEVALNEEFVARVLQSPHVLGEKLVGFFIWALKNDGSLKTSRAIELLARTISSPTKLEKKEAYMLWDLIKEVGVEKGLLNTEILNYLISMFWKLGKAKAALEVFNNFDEFACSPDGDTYYYTLEALGKRSMFDTAWSISEKMLSSGRLPDCDKIGKIIRFFCKGKKAKEAHLIYLMAKENKLYPPRCSLDFLIGGLTRNDETVHLALELLEDYPGESLKYANKTFGSVVRGLCRIKDFQEAKKLLLRMVDKGPPPGNAVFNYVITALSKGGEMEDAITLMKVMEGRGLRPDVYTYTVVMSGFAKGGLLDDAYKVFCEAKKRHSKLSPITYHILIRGYCKMEEFARALDCLKEMKGDGIEPNTDEYNKLIQSLCLKALDWRTAENLLEEMRESGLYLKGITQSLIEAVKELEEEEVQSEGVHVAA